MFSSIQCLIPHILLSTESRFASYFYLDYSLEFYPYCHIHIVFKVKQVLWVFWVNFSTLWKIENLNLSLHKSEVIVLKTAVLTFRTFPNNDRVLLMVNQPILWKWRSLPCWSQFLEPTSIHAVLYKRFNKHTNKLFMVGLRVIHFEGT